ncbi:MAG: hypothetical protein BBJ60_07685 [Desulfobacterales bacterium S7086C20]|nr:MAG: hypothetical protein BBJ60_07685 [Desulfobacterales bacterium S7086C20]
MCRALPGLLNGAVRYYDTGVGQSPDPARRRRRVAKGKGGCSEGALALGGKVLLFLENPWE